MGHLTARLSGISLLKPMCGPPCGNVSVRWCQDHDSWPPQSSSRWRAVDQDGHIRDILVHRRRDTKAAKTFFRKLFKGLTYVLQVIITDQLQNDGAAWREILPSVDHRQHRYLNNRAANSHPPTRQRERRMGRFKFSGYAQRFLAAYDLMASHFLPRRHRLSAPAYRQKIAQQFQTWQEVTGTTRAASGTSELLPVPLCPR
jgi:putative transposase